MTGSKRTLAVFAASALFAPLVSLGSPALAAGEATPPAPRDVTELCQNVPNNYQPFTDINGNTFEQNIECLAFAEITQGLSGGNQYGPGFSVTRGQMASFIARMIDTANDLDTGNNIKELPAFDGSDAFIDVADGYVHRQNIDRLDEAGIVEGGPGGRPANVYGPELEVTRAQMASFIKRALEYMTGDNFDTALDFFTDDENAQPHEPNINAVAAEGIAVGDGNNTYNPFQSVSRGQMSAFLTRTLDVLFEDGDIDAIGDDEGPGDAPVLESVEGTDVDNDGVLSAGDTIVLTFDQDVVTESAVLLEDEDGDETRLTDDTTQGAGDTDSDFEGSGTEEITVTLNEDPSEELDGSIEVTGLEGIVSEETGEEAELGNAETTFELADGPNQGQVAITSSTVQQGGTVSGTISGDATSATVSGCGLNNQSVTDTQTGAGNPGIQFNLTIPASQPAGQCTLTFTITRADNTTVTETETITVTQQPVGQSATVLPELISAAIVSTTAANQPNPGTIVRYLFDEPVGTVQNANGFNLYTFAQNSSTNPASSTPIKADSATIDPQNPNAVLARFNAIVNTTPANGTTVTQNSTTADITLATVELGAVVDRQGLRNPIGDAPLGTGQQGNTQLTAGRTQAPDLVSLNFRQPATANQTAVDFVFDQNAFVQNTDPDNFSVVLSNATEIDCAAPTPTTANTGTGQGGGTTPGGNGTTTITVVCDNPGQQPLISPNGTPLTASNVIRGTVEAGAVGTTPTAGNAAFPGVNGAACGAGNGQGTTNRCNVLMATETPDGGTIAPDLVSVELRTSATGNDTVIFTFDQPVASVNNAGGFAVYRNGGLGTEVTGAASGAAPAISGNQVAVFFANNTVRDLTGGNVAQGAVTGQPSGQQPGTANADDEAPTTNVQQPSQTQQPAGSTIGPDLTGVAITQGGTFNNNRVTFTFDEDVFMLQPTSFTAILADGTFIPASNCAVGTTEETDNVVTCTEFNFAGLPQFGTEAQRNSAIGSAVLGTVARGAVANQTGGTNPGTQGGETNPEGAAIATGTTGTPAS